MSYKVYDYLSVVARGGKLHNRTCTKLFTFHNPYTGEPWFDGCAVHLEAGIDGDGLVQASKDLDVGQSVNHEGYAVITRVR